MKIELKKPAKELRAKSYPKLEEQLDALWHGMEADKELRIEPFYSMIKQVKDAVPK